MESPQRCVKEGERGEGTRGEGAGVYGPHWLRDLQAPRLCSALIIFGGEDKRKKGISEERPGI